MDLITRTSCAEKDASDSRRHDKTRKAACLQLLQGLGFPSTTKKVRFMNYVHGGDVYRRAVDLDYSVNINPLGMPPRACAAAKHGVDQSTAYPDWKVEKLRDAVVSFLNRKFASDLPSAGANADISVPFARVRADVASASTSAGAAVAVPVPEEIETHEACTGGPRAVAPEWITFGNGAADLIYRLMQVLHPQQVVVAAPAFAEYSVAAERVGAQVVPVYLPEVDDFSFTPAVEAEFIRAIEAAPSGSAVFLCNPNNPDGNVIRAEVLQRIAEACEARHSWLIVDECFLPFLRSGDSPNRTEECFSEMESGQEAEKCGARTPKAIYSNDSSKAAAMQCSNAEYALRPNELECSMVPLLSVYPHLVILRAFTKIYGMPGLRLGYMLTAAQALTDAVRATMTPWEINLPAQLAGVAALEETEFVEKTRALIRAERAFLVQTLPTLPYVEKVYVPVSDANFILFRTAWNGQPTQAEKEDKTVCTQPLGDSHGESERRPAPESLAEPVDLKELLLEKGVLIRACGNYEGLDDRYYRICVRTHEENLELMHRWCTLQR